MEAIGNYILRLCCCAIIAGAVMSIGGDGAGSRVRKMICGLFIAFVAISPLREFETWKIPELPDDLYQQGLEISACAQEETNDAIREVIIQQTTAYILDEAESLNASIRVTRLSLDPDTLAPDGVTLSGHVSPYQRTLLSGYIEDTLGIGKEEQEWANQ